MLDYRERSKERLSSEVEKLIKDLFVSCLDRAEKIFNPRKGSDTWNQFRFGVLNLGNDKLRRLRDIMAEYTVEYRPSIFSVEYKIDVPVEKVAEFRFVADEKNAALYIISNNKATAESLKGALGCGRCYEHEKRHYFIVEGLFDCFHKVIPIFNQNDCFKGRTLEEYNTWKEKVYSLEKGNA